MFSEETVRRLSDAKLMDDQEQIQVELDRIAGEDFPSDQDLRFRDDLHRALVLCNAEMMRRGLLEAPR